MRGPPGSLARSGLFRGPVASCSPRGRCKGFRVPGPDREPLADQEPSRCLPHRPSREAPQMTRCRENTRAPIEPWRGRLPAVLAPLRGFLCCRQPDRTCPATRPHPMRDATTSRPPEDRSSWLAQERGETPPSPNPRPGPLDDAMRSLAFSTPWRGFAGLAGLGLYVERTR